MLCALILSGSFALFFAGIITGAFLLALSERSLPVDDPEKCNTSEASEDDL